MILLLWFTIVINTCYSLSNSKVERINDTSDNSLYDLIHRFQNTNASSFSSSKYEEVQINILRLYSENQIIGHVKNEIIFQGCAYHQFAQQIKRKTLLIFDSSTTDLAEAIQACNYSIHYEALRLPDNVNASFLYKEMYPWKSTTVKLFMILCQHEKSVLILEVLKSLKLQTNDYIYVVNCSEVWYGGLDMPKNTVTLKINTHLKSSYQIESVNKTEQSCSILFLNEEGAKWYKIGEVTPTKAYITVENILPGLLMERVVKKLKVVTIEEPPFTFFRDVYYDRHENFCSQGKLCKKYEVVNNTKEWVPHCCVGYCIDLLIKVEQELDIMAEVYFVKDGAYGSLFNGTWTGMVADLVNGKADIILAYLSIGESRSKAIDFTIPYLSSDFVLVTNSHPHLTSYFNMRAFSSLSGTLWLTVFLITIISSVMLVITDNSVSNNIEEKYSWRESITYLTGLLFQRDIGGMNPQFMGSRTISISLAIAMMVIMSTYTAVLTANSVSDNNHIPITGFTDHKIIHPTTAFTYGTVENSYLTQFFHDSTDPDMNRIFHFMKAYNYRRFSEGPKLLEERKLDAYIEEIVLAQYHIGKQKECTMEIAARSIRTAGAGIAVQKGNKLRTTLSHMIANYEEDDTLHQLNIKWLESRCLAENSQGPEQLQIVHFGGLVFVCALCVGLSGCVFLIEYFVSKCLGTGTYKLRNAETFNS